MLFQGLNGLDLILIVLFCVISFYLMKRGK